MIKIIDKSKEMNVLLVEEIVLYYFLPSIYGEHWTKSKLVKI